MAVLALPSYPDPDSHQCQNVVYWRTRDNLKRERNRKTKIDGYVPVGRCKRWANFSLNFKH